MAEVQRHVAKELPEPIAEEEVLPEPIETQVDPGATVPSDPEPGKKGPGEPAEKEQEGAKFQTDLIA